MAGDDPRHFFFYGTLQSEQSGEAARLILPKLKRVGEGVILGRLFGIRAPHLTYPALFLEGANGQRVQGVCYEMGPEFNSAALNFLDAYEEYYPTAPSKSEYLRQAHSVMLNSGGEVSAWVYVYNFPLSETAEPIPSGDFRKYIRRG